MSDAVGSSAFCSPLTCKPSGSRFALVLCLPITMAWCMLWLLLITLYALVSGQNLAPDDYIRIDCGGFSDFTVMNQTWVSDRFYSGGAPAAVLDPERFSQPQERTLRFFPVTLGKKNCYVVNVPNGRYFIRMFFVYDNYDRKMHSPSFDVSVEGTVVFSWRNPWDNVIAGSGAYSDLYAFIHDDAATVCFYSIATDAPVIGALELLQVDPLSYNSSSTGESVILINYGRVTGGPNPFGPGYNQDQDWGGRSWEVDDSYSSSPKSYFSTLQPIVNSSLPPNYFPTRLYQTSRYLPQGGNIQYNFPLDASLDYTIWFHFAEIDPKVNGTGQRMFDIYVNGQMVRTQLDIFQEAGGSFAAYDWQYTLKNLTGSSVQISFVPRTGSPSVCGLEIYALLPMDISTNATEAMAMQALKGALQIPERMGWNGDPCAPTSWDAWEGVTCNMAVDNSALVITHISIAGQGLKGSISDKIPLLSHLITLNVSNNMLEGSIPEGLGQNSLVSVDLSANSLTGAIPASLGSGQLQQVLLGNNQLTGKVPEAVYSIGVHGGFINLSSNVGLCGVPSLPPCPYFWKRGGLSTGGKIGVVVGTLIMAILVLGLVYLYIQCRGRHEDYNFNLPHQLATRTKWYQNQMSAREAEDVSMMRSNSSTKFGFASNMTPL